MGEEFSISVGYGNNIYREKFGIWISIKPMKKFGNYLELSRGETVRQLGRFTNW